MAAYLQTDIEQHDEDPASSQGSDASISAASDDRDRLGPVPVIPCDGASDGPAQGARASATARTTAATAIRATANATSARRGRATVRRWAAARAFAPASSAAADRATCSPLVDEPAASASVPRGATAGSATAFLSPVSPWSIRSRTCAQFTASAWRVFSTGPALRAPACRSLHDTAPLSAHADHALATAAFGWDPSCSLNSFCWRLSSMASGRQIAR